MAYELTWSSIHPGHLVYLLDLSQSMALNGRIDYLLEAVKNTCEFLIERSICGSVVKDRFSVNVLCYNTDVYTLFKGSERELDAKLEEIYLKKIGYVPLFDKTSEAMQRGQKKTTRAFHAVTEYNMEWINDQQRRKMIIPAPIIIHITDGRPIENQRDQIEATEDALRAVEEIKQINLPYGNQILFNIHFNNGTPVYLFLTQNSDEEDLQFLFYTSSVMNDRFVITGREL